MPGGSSIFPFRAQRNPERVVGRKLLNTDPRHELAPNEPPN
jgi:hypothetical protein